MYVLVELPEIKVDYQAFGGFWLKFMFGGGVSDNYQVGTLAATFVRLVESSIREYQLGVAGTKEYFATHDKIALGAIQQATSYFESCISDMHRAVKCFTRLRRHRQLGRLKIVNTGHPTFVSASVHDHLRNARNQIHHMESMVMKGQIVQGQSIAIRADGPTVAHPSEAGQTIKTIDRLVIGNCEIPAKSIAEWLLEMAKVCEQMAV